MDSLFLTRRRLLQAGITTLTVASGSNVAAATIDPTAPDRWRGLKIGVATYTLRELPLEAAIKAVRRVGLGYVSIKDVHLSLKSSVEERRATAAKFREAGLTPLSCGNITLQNNEVNIRQAFEYARDTGLPTIVCSPHPDSFPILDRMVKEFDIRLAIHNHGPEDKHFPSPNEVWTAVQPYDRRIGLCIDIGHTARARRNPVEMIQKYHERLYDLHFKDITPQGAPIECGRGILDLKAVLKALLALRYSHHIGFEYEKDASDPVPGLAESVGYAHGLLAG